MKRSITPINASNSVRHSLTDVLSRRIHKRSIEPIRVLTSDVLLDITTSIAGSLDPIK